MGLIVQAAAFNPAVGLGIPRRSVHRTKKVRLCVQCLASMEQKSPKLVTFLGKGGVGKSTCAVIAAQYYASIGLQTCLVVQSQDLTADVLLGQPLKQAPLTLNDGLLTAFRLESTKILAEQLQQTKKADARVNSSQGAIQEVAGEELSILPGMDSLIALFRLEQLTGFTRRHTKSWKPKYDVIVYDGSNSEETLRLFASAERSRWYMNRFRSVAEKTDIGRLAIPSIIRLTEAAIVEDTTTQRTTQELFEQADSVLKGVQRSFANPKQFSSFIVTNPTNTLSEKMAHRYWGCSMQAGIHVAGLLHRKDQTNETWKDKYSPLKVAAVPNLSYESAPNWEELITGLDGSTREVLQGDVSTTQEPVMINAPARTVTCFLPGFDKTEVKLSQLKKSELLLEAGDQRRVIELPVQMHGKVRGAKFKDRSLVIQL